MLSAEPNKITRPSPDRAATTDGQRTNLEEIAHVVESDGRSRREMGYVQPPEPRGLVSLDRFPLRRSNSVAAVPGVVRAFVWREEVECPGDQPAHLLKVPRARGA